MSDSALRELIEWCSAKAEAHFAEVGHLTPLWICLDDDGEMHLVEETPSSDLVVARMRVFFALLSIEMYCLVDEAWTAELTSQAEITGAFEQPAKEEGVAGLAQRREAVMFIAEDRERTLTASRAIQRAGDKPPTLGPLEVDDKPALSGRLVGLLPRRGALQ